MSEIYKFYVKMDGQTFGPYSARAVRDLELLDDILVTEESLNGQWFPASKFDFDDMVRNEDGTTVSQPTTPKHIIAGGVINSDGTETNPNGWQPQPPLTAVANADDNSTPIGWCILSFLIPLVGWILYFSWRRTKPHKASAVCTWAWVGFALNLLNLIVTFAGM